MSAVLQPRTANGTFTRKAWPARFWAKVDKRGPDECWNWTAYCLPGRDGKRWHGLFWFDGKQTVAHRVSWELHNGAIPEGMLVCHTCDNPRCVNPTHLFIGTQSDNLKDAVAKGRQVALGWSKRTRCVRGHEFGGENLHVRPNGHRECLECKRLRNAAKMWKSGRYVRAPERGAYGSESKTGGANTKPYVGEADASKEE